MYDTHCENGYNIARWSSDARYLLIIFYVTVHFVRVCLSRRRYRLSRSCRFYRSRARSMPKRRAYAEESPELASLLPVGDGSIFFHHSENPLPNLMSKVAISDGILTNKVTAARNNGQHAGTPSRVYARYIREKTSRSKEISSVWRTAMAQ